MSRSLMLARALSLASVPVLVDLGYLNDKASRDAADRLLAAGLSVRNLSIEGHNRLLAKLPPKKATALIERCELLEGGRYWQTTHRRKGLDAGEG